MGLGLGLELGLKLGLGLGVGCVGLGLGLGLRLPHPARDPGAARRGIGLALGPRIVRLPLPLHRGADLLRLGAGGKGADFLRCAREQRGGVEPVSQLLRRALEPDAAVGVLGSAPLARRREAAPEVHVVDPEVQAEGAQLLTVGVWVRVRVRVRVG